MYAPSYFAYAAILLHITISYCFCEHYRNSKTHSLAVNNAHRSAYYCRNKVTPAIIYTCIYIGYIYIYIYIYVYNIITRVHAMTTRAYIISRTAVRIVYTDILLVQACSAVSYRLMCLARAERWR